MKFKGKYLNGKRNGKGREYNEDGQIIFKGEYLNDLQWNGKGYDSFNNITYELKDGKGFVKEYYDCSKNLKFKGEYLNGQKNGIGKEYNDEGQLIFKGEYINGQKNGFGVEYNEYGLVKFVGEYINGKKLEKGFSNTILDYFLRANIYMILK